MMPETIFERHPVITLAAFILVVLLLIGLAAEIILRFTLPYDIGFYSATKKEGVYHYAYGDMAINSEGYPDAEFDLSGTKKRIGYFGDSIIMGVGAGDGYRISDLLEKQYPQYDHWTFGRMGNGLVEQHFWNLVDAYKIDKVIYGFNLNDFLPPPNAAGQDQDETLLRKIEKFVWAHTDWLRGKSYLYTAVRTSIKNILQRAGYGHTGYKAMELYPIQNEDLIRSIALRLNAVQKELETRNIDFCFIIFPYEMQISEPAAETYRSLGIEWEDGFETGSTQDIFKKYLTLPQVYDGRVAFKDHPDAPTGTYFVYNKGDKIDFNHPNRAGHALLANGLIASKTCDFLAQ